MATIFPLNPSVGDQFDGYVWNGVSWNIIGNYPTTNFVTESEFNLYRDNTIIAYIQDTQPDFGGKKAVWVQTGLGPLSNKISIWINT